MMKDAAPSLQQLMSRLRAQALEIATLRSALDVQFSRITVRQAELDVLTTWPADGGTRFGAPLAGPKAHSGRRRGRDWRPSLR